MKGEVTLTFALWKTTMHYATISVGTTNKERYKEQYMRKYIMIAAGGFLGAILRFSMKLLELPIPSGGLPIHTLIINVLGSLLLGFFMTVSTDVFKLKEAEKLGITTGFLGAFTTFSTISKEASQELAAGSFAIVALYSLLSITLGLAAIFIGAKLGERLISAQQSTED